MADVDEALETLRGTLGTKDESLCVRDISNIMVAWKILESSITELNEFPEPWDDSNRYA